MNNGTQAAEKTPSGKNASPVPQGPAFTPPTAPTRPGTINWAETFKTNPTIRGAYYESSIRRRVTDTVAGVALSPQLRIFDSIARGQIKGTLEERSNDVSGEAMLTVGVLAGPAGMRRVTAFGKDVDALKQAIALVKDGKAVCFDFVVQTMHRNRQVAVGTRVASEQSDSRGDILLGLYAHDAEGNIATLLEAPGQPAQGRQSNFAA